MINKKGKINGSIYEIVTMEEYEKNREVYDNKFVAIESDGLLYPITKTKNTPGYFDRGPDQLFVQFIKPPEDCIDEYRATGNHIIDFNATSSMKEYMEKSMNLKDMEKEILCSPDNKFHPIILQEDDEIMRGLKEAVITKDIDIDKYATRFGPNFNNDKRLFKKNSITLKKFKTMADNLDIKATLILEDKSPDVANPINKVIRVEITGNNDEDNE